MTHAISIIRIAVLLTLAIAAAAGILATPADHSGAWLLGLLATKALGIAAAAACFRLHRRWAAADPWIAAYHAWQARGIRGQY